VSGPGVSGAGVSGAGVGGAGEADRLERAYRRLLACYPARHRGPHGEEMLGVLLAAAPDGQRRPGLRDAANLVWGALLIRLRPSPARAAGRGWREALALFSLAAPLALTAAFATEFLIGRRLANFSLEQFAVGVALFGLGLALPFVLRGARRAAVTACCAATALLACEAVMFLVSAPTVRTVGLAAVVAFPLYAYATEAVALLRSPGPRRGRRLLTWRGRVLAVLAGVAGGVLHWAVLGGPAVLAALAAAVLCLIVAGLAARSAAGRRLLVLFAIPLNPWLIGMFWPSLDSTVGTTLVTFLPPLAILGLILRSTQRDRQRDPRPGQAVGA
jgi:hypothetical protein